MIKYQAGNVMISEVNPNFIDIGQANDVLIWQGVISENECL
jgi:hypothetical protein